MPKIYTFTQSEDTQYFWRDSDDKAIRVTRSDENTFYVSEGYREDDTKRADMFNFCYVKPMFEVDKEISISMLIDVLFRHMI